jgi:hypothetical protein
MIFRLSHLLRSSGSNWISDFPLRFLKPRRYCKILFINLERDFQVFSLSQVLNPFRSELWV